MKKARLLVLLFPLVLLSSPAWAVCCMMGGMGTAPGMMSGGMMGHGMGMGPGMMDDGMMGGGMMGGGMMGRGMQSCMLQECWQQDMHGRTGVIMPQTTVHTAFREISGYQVNAAALGLNEDQLQRLNDIKEALTASMIRTHADLQIGAIDLRRVMSREMPDIPAAEKILDSHNQMWSKLQKMAIRAVAESRNVLSAQQRQQARKITAAGPMMRQMPMQQQRPEAPPPGHEQHHRDGN
jgi:hypothetical protein